MSVLIVKTGQTLDRLKFRGDFEDWFTQGLGLQTNLVNVVNNESLPQPEQCKAIVVTGSPAMVSHRLDWSESTAAWIQQVHQLEIPMLGVCYGHQLIAHALGGEVGPNPHGRQIGTVELELDEKKTAQDALFSGLPASLKVQATHLESVLALPVGSSVLASTKLDPNHVVHFGAKTWGMQFHPEFDAQIIDAYLKERREPIIQEGLDPDAISLALEDTDWGPELLRRFALLVAE